MKESLCFSCAWADIKIETVQVPLFATSTETRPAQHLFIWCNESASLKTKLVTWSSHTCNYKPRVGKIGKKTTQTTLL